MSLRASCSLRRGQPRRLPILRVTWRGTASSSTDELSVGTTAADEHPSHGCGEGRVSECGSSGTGVPTGLARDIEGERRRPWTRGGRGGRRLAIPAPRAAPLGQGVQAPLKRGRTYLLLLADVPRTRYFFVVGGNVGAFE